MILNSPNNLNLLELLEEFQIVSCFFTELYLVQYSLSLERELEEKQNATRPLMLRQSTKPSEDFKSKDHDEAEPRPYNKFYSC